MRLSLKESRMKLLNVTNLDRKSGIRGPKTMGEALRTLYSIPKRLITEPARQPRRSLSIRQPLQPESPHSPCHPDRISYFALLTTTTCATLRNESRMQIIKTTGLNRKSGGPTGGICSAPYGPLKFFL
jgi:hypothetical protein